MEGNEHDHRQALKICIAGGGDTDHCGLESFEKGEALGIAIAKRGDVILNAASHGFSAWASQGASRAGGHSIGFSPAKDKLEHVEMFELPIDGAETIIYTGLQPLERNLMLTQASDAVIIGCGRLGAINEFTVAYELERPIGILRGEWTTDEVIEQMIEHADLKRDKIVISNDIEALLEELCTLAERERENRLPTHDASEGIAKKRTGSMM